MQLKNIFNIFKEKPVVAPQLDSEMGDSGTTIYDGYISGEEYNNDLVGRAKYLAYDKMRKGDATVAVSLKVVKLPLRSANWYVEAASEEDQDKEIAGFIENNLKNQMTITWDDFLRQALLMLDYGVFPFEKVFQYVEYNGKQYIGWKKFAPRHPRTITKWAIKKSGDGITQQKTIDVGEAHIPMDKLLVFVNEKEGDNWEGISLLRTAYKHWFYKDNFEQIDAMSFERQGLGVPYCQVPKGANSKDKKNAKELVKNLRANEKAYVVYPEGWEVGFLDMNSKSTRDPKESIAHHQRSIVLNVLAQFLMLGSSDGSGSRALSEDHSALFFDSLQAVAKQILDVINKYAIKQIVDINFPGYGIYPKLKVDDIGSIDKKAFSDMMKTLVGEELIDKDDSLENYIRKELDLPDMVEKDDEDEVTERLEIELDMLQVEIAGEGMEEPELDSQEEEETEVAATEELIDEELIFGAKGKPLSDETKKKISEALRKKHGNKIKEEKGKVGRSQDNIADARRRIEELKTVVSNFKEKAKSIKDKTLKKEFNKQIKIKIEEIKKMIKSGRVGIKVERQKIRESKKEIRTENKELVKERKQRKINRQIDRDEARIKKLEKTIKDRESKAKDKKDLEKLDRIRERIETINQRISDNNERKEELEMSEDEKKNLIFKFEPRRKLTYAEKKVNFGNLNREFERAEKELEKLLNQSFKDQKDELLKSFQKAVKAKNYKAIEAITLAAPKKYKQKLLDEMKALYNFGKNTASAEMKIVTPATPISEVERLSAGSGIIVDSHESRIMTSSKIEAMNGVSKGKSTTDTIKLVNATMVKAAKELAQQTGSIIAGGMINDGRRLVQQDNKKNIYALQRSELLDDRTCNFCESIDGRVIKVSDPWAQEGIIHSNCRGIWVEIMNNEPEKPKINGIPESIAKRYQKTNDFKQLKSPIVKKDSLAADEVKKQYAKEIKSRQKKIDKYESDGKYPNRVKAHKKEIDRMNNVLNKLK